MNENEIIDGLDDHDLHKFVCLTHRECFYPFGNESGINCVFCHFAEGVLYQYDVQKWWPLAWSLINEWDVMLFCWMGDEPELGVEFSYHKIDTHHVDPGTAVCRAWLKAWCQMLTHIWPFKTVDK